MKPSRIFLLSVATALLMSVAKPASGNAQEPETQGPTGESEGAAAEETTAEDEATEEAATEEPAPPPPDERLEEARERIGTGETLFEQGNYDAALAEFQRAGDLLSDHPMHFLVLYNIGKCYEQLFRYGDAMEYYRRYLEEGGAEQPDAGEVRAKIDVLQSLLGTIQVRVNVTGYEVWVDGRRIGEDVTTVLVPGGSHRVEVRAEGYVQETEEVQLTARGEASVSFELTALAEEYGGLSPGIFWGAAGVAAASLVGGVVLGGVAISRRNAVNDSRGTPSEITTATPAEQDRIKGLSIGADVLFGSALIFGATAVGLAFATDWSGDGGVNADGDGEDSASAGVRLRWNAGVSRQGAVVGVGGAF